MRVLRIIMLVISLIQVLSCTKEEDSLQVTSFEGIVLSHETNEPFTNGQIEIIGSEIGSYGDFRKSFQIASDGTFNIKVDTRKINNFQINVESPNYDSVYQSCTGSSISGFCTLMEAGIAHVNIRVFAQIISSN